MSQPGAAAYELRDLRRVARAARDLADWLHENNTVGCAPLDVLETMLAMARETSPFLHGESK